MAYTNAVFYMDLESGSDAARTALTTVTVANPSGTITRATKTAHGLATGAVVDLTLFSAWLNVAWKITVVDADNFDLDTAVWQATADNNGTATPRGGSSKADAWLTFTSGPTSSRVAAGDVIRVKATADPTSLGINATWTDNNGIITLASSLTQMIDDCETAWTAATNVTATASSTNWREGTKSSNLVVAAGFTTGLAAYHATSANLDLSAYQQISFWVKSSVALASGAIVIKLCSDSAGATPLDTLTLNYAINSTSTWHPVVIDKGSALSSGINSIAIYFASDPGSTTVNLDNIIACKASSAADSLTLRSMIGKNTGGEPEWWPIRSINGTTINLDGNLSDSVAASNAAMLYHGTTETVATYKRESLMLTAQQTVQQAGSVNSWLEFSFGWDRTNMTSQSGDTWLSRECRPSSGSYLVFTPNAKTYVKYTKLRIHNAYIGINLATCNDLWFYDLAFSGVCHGFELSGSNVANRILIEQMKFMICTEIGLNLAGSAGVGPVRMKQGGRMIGNGNLSTTNSALAWTGNAILDLDVQEMVGWGWCVYGPAGADVILRNTKIWRVTSTISLNGSVAGRFVRGFNLDLAAAPSLTAYAWVAIMKYGKTADDHRIFYGINDTIKSATDQRHTASDFSWKFTTGASSAASSAFPMSLSAARVAVNASALVTVSIWVRRDNTALNMRLRVPGAQIGGVADDVIANAAGSANAWEQLTVTFTPTEAGVVEVFCEAWGYSAAYNGWCDDRSISQA